MDYCMCNCRVFVIGTVAISIAWIPVIQNIAELFHYIQSIQSFLSPPICAVYLLAILWKRINEQVNLKIMRRARFYKMSTSHKFC